jgi:hypothetical protein
MKKQLVGILIAGLGTAAPAQPKDEWLGQAPLAGFAVGYRAAENGSAIVEWVPQGETVDHWTRMVTVQRFAGIGARLRFWVDTFPPNLARSCPGAVVSRPVYSESLGRQQAAFRVDCPRNPETGQPETFLLRAIAGAADLHSLQVAYRHVPSAQEIEWAERQLASARLCGPESSDAICRTPGD